MTTQNALTETPTISPERVYLLKQGATPATPAERKFAESLWHVWGGFTPVTKLPDDNDYSDLVPMGEFDR